MASSDTHPSASQETLFDMCWDTEADQVPMVETQNLMPSAEQQVRGQTFDMCWDTEVDSAPIITPEAVTLLAAGLYNLCWDDKPHVPMVVLAPIRELEPRKTKILDVTLPFAAGQYDMCWNDSLSVSVVAYKADFDMCWGDSPSGGDGHLEGISIVALTINLVDLAGDTPVFYDMCFENISVATSTAPRDGSPSQTAESNRNLLRRAASPGPRERLPSQTVEAGEELLQQTASPGSRERLSSQTVEAGEELLCRANMSLDFIDTMISKFILLLIMNIMRRATLDRR
ncbi:uncharacterized protein F5147DRAFT_770305 [Suillus discolor]|uniref:Uncharacterized protein n=1 Tax=Suillus discolor TaxID=1912936 RepID=A0A9P7FCP6_9AGAM|nr:uncharacterized protein F5147DRAFT_770305 [Suillus discolor]KAG2114323.1 hypothetical protein F5147DRAFT_770305 [Suillus discolor]